MAASPTNSTPPSRGSRRARWPARVPGRVDRAQAGERQRLAVVHFVLDGDGLAGLRRTPSHEPRDERAQRPGPRLERTRAARPSRTSAASAGCIHTSAPVRPFTVASPPMWSPWKCVITMPRTSSGRRPRSRMACPMRARAARGAGVDEDQATGGAGARGRRSSRSTRKAFTPPRRDLVHPGRDALSARGSCRASLRPPSRRGPLQARRGAAVYACARVRGQVRRPAQGRLAGVR